MIYPNLIKMSATEEERQAFDQEWLEKVDPNKQLSYAELKQKFIQENEIAYAENKAKESGSAVLKAISKDDTGEALKLFENVKTEFKRHGLPESLANSIFRLIEVMTQKQIESVVRSAANGTTPPSVYSEK